MRSCRVIVSLGTPAIITVAAPALDGIVFEALQQKHPDASTEQLLEKMKQIIKFSDEYGVFHSSFMRFVATKDAAVTVRKVIKTDCIREDKLKSGFFAPTGKGGSYPKIDTKRGKYISRMTERNAFCSEKVFFDAYGDKELLLSILTNTHIGIGHDARNGCGDILSVEIYEHEEDISLSLNGSVNRSMPFEAALKMNLKGDPLDSPLIPPYYIKANARKTLVPERIRVILEDQLYHYN